jgi:hypothetical protein
LVARPVGHAGEVDDAELAAQLIDRMARDQEAREAVRGLGDDVVWDRVRAVDVDNTVWLKQVIDERGWPRRADVGEKAARAAWLLAQHADDDVGFQHRCLALLTDAVSRGDADAGDLAYLTDRVRRADGLPQLYGTQFQNGPDGRLIPQPIEDIADLDERRHRVGLPPFDEYEELINQQYPHAARAG